MKEYCVGDQTMSPSVQFTRDIDHTSRFVKVQSAEDDKGRRIVVKTYTNEIPLCEIVILSCLKSPYVLCGEGVMDNDGNIAVILPRAKCDLRSWLSGNPSSQQRITACGQITRGLKDLHRFGFYHCDIKPDNVLIMEDGRAVLSDFNISTAIQTKPICGIKYTETHRPPEIPSDWDTEYVLQEGSDVFALGRLFMDIADPSCTSLLELAKMMTQSDIDKRPSLSSVLSVFEPLVEFDASTMMVTRNTHNKCSSLREYVRGYDCDNREEEIAVAFAMAAAPYVDGVETDIFASTIVIASVLISQSRRTSGLLQAACVDESNADKVMQLIKRIVLETDGKLI